MSKIDDAEKQNFINALNNFAKIEVKRKRYVLLMDHREQEFATNLNEWARKGYRVVSHSMATLPNSTDATDMVKDAKAQGSTFAYTAVLKLQSKSKQNKKRG